MRVAYCSDIHYDIWFEQTRKNPNIINDCNADVLILGGDIFEYGIWSEFFHSKIIDMLCDRFKYVIMIDGNHEFYGIEFESDIAYDLLKNTPKNFKYLRNESVDIDGITFYGGTFWTSPENWNPIEEFDIKANINDFKHIKGMTNKRLIESHNEFLENLMCIQTKNDIVVISHYPPTEMSIDDRYLGHVTNSYFCNPYYYEFCDSEQIKHWVCGHVHHRHDFELGNIKGHCNPIGYPRDMNEIVMDYFDI